MKYMFQFINFGYCSDYFDNWEDTKKAILKACFQVAIYRESKVVGEFVHIGSFCPINGFRFEKDLKPM